MQAIETKYDGFHFRSRLEARWAVFFNTLGVQFEYEAEGFQDGATRYLPDFWLPVQKCWIEIKGPELSEDHFKKAIVAAKSTGRFVFLFRDCWGIECKNLEVTNTGNYVSPSGDRDGCQSFGICPQCDAVCIGHFGSHRITYTTEDGLFGIPDCGAEAKAGIDKHERLLRAFSAARSYRF